MAWAAEPGNRIVTLADAAYPRALLTTADPPVLLYVKGRAELLNHPALAIVGSRNATKQGEANAEAFAATLAAAGLTVVSGLALGIDAAAHRGALGVQGGSGSSTIAVIGTGADRIYPSRNEALTRAIAERGCIVSEFPLGTAALPGNFPRRNRLIAGISLGCLVVEAAAKSGSLITARLAADAKTAPELAPKQEELDHGGYASPSEYVRDLIRRKRQERIEADVALLAKAIHGAPEAEPEEEVFRELYAAQRKSRAVRRRCRRASARRLSAQSRAGYWRQNPPNDRPPGSGGRAWPPMPPPTFFWTYRAGENPA